MFFLSQKTKQNKTNAREEFDTSNFIYKTFGKLRLIL